MGRCSLKDKLNKQHVADRPACNGQEHPSLPYMEPHGYNDGNQFRQTMATLNNRHVPQAIDDQHGKDGAGQHLAEVLNALWRRSLGIEHQNGRKRVSMVPTTHMPTVMNSCDSVTVLCPPFSVPSSVPSAF